MVNKRDGHSKHVQQGMGEASQAEAGPAKGKRAFPGSYLVHAVQSGLVRRVGQLQALFYDCIQAMQDEALAQTALEGCSPPSIGFMKESCANVTQKAAPAAQRAWVEG